MPTRGNKKRYNVLFTKTIDINIIVEAENEDEAREVAINKFDSLTEEEQHADPDINIQEGYFEFAYADEL